ncbi:hypothetical protein TWF694_009110 [Orbilia ellipsospora]|uniref:C-CAP/cofactor C-like domain-containing protein n=1 Tax=Orbilia ellipsospora TaxID=2528407 RepID=A0AAV9XKM6_9PEZI
MDEPVAEEEVVEEGVAEKEEDPRQLFHKSFTAETKGLTDTITSLATSRASERQASIDNILSKIGVLTHDLGDASTYLPAYDQRVYSEQLKSLSDQLSNARKALAPRQKFSFKNRGSSRTSGTDSPTPPLPAVPAEQLQASLQPLSSKSQPDPKTTSTITSHENTNLQTSPPNQTTTILSLSNLKSCILTPHNNDKSATGDTNYTTLSVTSISSSLLIIPPIQGPAHLTSLQNTTILLSCHQFRLHSSHNVDVYLKCRSRPIIENCKGIRVSFLPDISNKSAATEGGGNSNVEGKADGKEESDMWNQIDDFNWLKVDKPSPNWRCLRDDERILDDVWDTLLTTTTANPTDILDKVLPSNSV